MARTMTLGQAVKGARKAPASKFAYWLDKCLKTKAISPEAEAQREHDKVAVAIMREYLRRRQADIEAAWATA